MIPILQFDPSSLAIWYDTHLINRMRGGEIIGQSLDLAMREKIPDLRTHIDGIDDQWVKTRSATVASAVWHEKRHFLDFILTNYGAFRIRQFLLLYYHLPIVRKFASDSKSLLLPLESYLDETFCEINDVPHPSSDIIGIAKDIATRKEMLLDDRRILDSRFGSHEVGGEAILEALAHHFETVKTQLFFGPELSLRIRSDVPDEALVAARYQWLYQLLRAADLIEFTVDDIPNYSTIDARVLVPICIASLCCRLWGQQQTKTEGTYSYLPGYRLGSLLPALIPHKNTLKAASVVECWNIVNDVCKEIFGRTALEELDADFTLEEQTIDKLKQNAESLAVRAYVDFHELRGRLISVLKTQPELILADFEYSVQMSTRLQPLVIVAASAGEFGDPPPDYDRLLGYREPDTDPDDILQRWWWAALSKKWPESDREDVFCLSDRRAWIDVIADEAPFAKLVMDGRNVRIMLGPELISAEARTSHSLNVQIQIAPAFRFPKSPITAENWYFITGHEELRCDITFETITKPDGVLIDPWTIRLWPSLMDHLLGRVADKRGMSQTFYRDWSPWVLSEEFRELTENVIEEGPLFAEINFGS